MTIVAAWKARALAEIAAEAAEFEALSAAIHADPELGFQEFRAVERLTTFLAGRSFSVERGIGGLPTAFRAEARGASDGPTVALLAEYDALPELGHACGHNLIAAASVAAACAVKAVLPGLAGRIVVIGTPAEEGGGGKIKLLEAGVFEGVDAALMVHPSSRTLVDKYSLASLRLALAFRGRAAHAAAAPEEGINALDAVLLTFNAIHALRLRLRPDAKVHGIITHGGTAVNIIPDYAAAQFSVRAREMTYAEEVADRIVACAEGAALATGATLEWQQTAGYAELRPNPVLARLFAANWRAVGVAIEEVVPGENAGSTDVGNVSHVVPTLQPYIAIAPRGTAGHSIAFREAAISPRGQAAMLDAARGLALTAIDLLAEPALVAEARAALAQGPSSPRKE